MILLEGHKGCHINNRDLVKNIYGRLFATRGFPILFVDISGQFFGPTFETSCRDSCSILVLLHCYVLDLDKWHSILSPLNKAFKSNQMRYRSLWPGKDLTGKERPSCYRISCYSLSNHSLTFSICTFFETVFIIFLQVEFSINNVFQFPI